MFNYLEKCFDLLPIGGQVILAIGVLLIFSLILTFILYIIFYFYEKEERLRKIEKDIKKLKKDRKVGDKK